MNRLKLPAIFLMGLAAVTLALALSLDGPGRASAAPSFEATSGVGGQISIGTPSLVSGEVVVPVDTTATVDTYSGFVVHLKWNSAIFAFSSDDDGASGTLSAGAPLCFHTVDGGGGGVTVSCSSSVFPDGAVTAGGTLLNINLTPLGGCSTLHLFTLNAPDGGDSTTGTYTTNDADSKPQSNTYGSDITVDDTAATGCVAAATATATATDTATATNTPGAPTSTPTATGTPFGGFRTVTPTVTPPSTATPAPPPTEAPGAGGPPGAPGGAPGGAAGGPGGAPGGTIRLPNTGSQDNHGFASVAWLLTALSGVAALALGGAALWSWRRSMTGR